MDDILEGCTGIAIILFTLTFVGSCTYLENKKVNVKREIQLKALEVIKTNAT